MDEWINKINAWMDGFMTRSIDVWVDKWIDGQMNGYIIIMVDGWVG